MGNTKEDEEEFDGVATFECFLDDEEDDFFFSDSIKDVVEDDVVVVVVVVDDIVAFKFEDNKVNDKDDGECALLLMTSPDRSNVPLSGCHACVHSAASCCTCAQCLARCM